MEASDPTEPPADEGERGEGRTSKAVSSERPDPDADEDGFVPLGRYLARQSGGRAAPFLPDWIASNISSEGQVGLREYMDQVLEIIQRNRVQPTGSPVTESSEVRLRGRADGLTGRLLDCRVLVSSGDRAIDGAALETLRRSSPFPPIGVSGTLHFELTLRYDPGADNDG